MSSYNCGDERSNNNNNVESLIFQGARGVAAMEAAVGYATVTLSEMSGSSGVGGGKGGGGKEGGEVMAAVGWEGERSPNNNNVNPPPPPTSNA